MKLRLLISIPFLLLLTTASAQIDDFPSYEAVLHKFFSSYSIDSLKLSTINFLHFARKPSGWFIQVENISTKAMTSDELFWSNASKSWKSLRLSAVQADTSISNAYSNQYQYDSVYFELNLFYGYKGWERDVIKTLGPTIGKLGEKQYYQLARAYSSLADYTIWPQRSYNNEYLKFDSTFNPDDFPSIILNNYTRYRDSAILLYHELLERDPYYPTFIGNIRTAYSNENVLTYFELSIVNQKKLAGKYLIDGLYDPFTLDFYRNILLACDPNTIFFTSGDNDTFVILYLQEHLGFRKDVTAVMRNYISLGRYVNYLSNLIPETNKLQATLPIDFYKPDNLFYHYLTRDDLRLNNAREFIQYVVANWKNTSEDSIISSNDSVVLNFPVNGDPNQLYTWTLTKNYYLEKDDVNFADLFSSNAFRRPIQFFYATFGLEARCRLQGLTYRVFPSLTQAESDSVDLANYDYLCNRFHYTDLDSLSQRNATVLNHIIYYVAGFGNTAQNLIAAHNNQLAINLLDKYFTLFPDSLIHFDFWTLYIAQYYYYAGAFPKGDQCMLRLAQRLRETLSEELKDKENNIQAINDNVRAMNNIINLIDQFNRPDPFKTKIKKICALP